MHRQSEITRLQPVEKVRQVSIEAYFHSLSKIIPRLPYATIEQIAAAITHAVGEGRTVFVFGNGGSAATASHVVCDLGKTVTENSENRRLKVIALTDNVPLMTAWANDAGYEHVFSEQLKNFVAPRDVVFAISCSGDSPNILQALKTARTAGAITVGTAGYEGGKMKALCDICAVIPSDNMQLIEDLQHAVAHSIFSVVRENLRQPHAITPLKSRAAGVGRAPK
ncbi:MAG TPA: SIS domain-containing protein [Candidatus Angelobacter sp.]|jgi:D-sedoheptulose 7-phosphate isomerase|nr:SIS domain-containing protein [Candidatus Angelobacter sp.]